MDEAELHYEEQAGPDEQNRQPPEPGPGPRLREARERRALSQDDIAASLRLSRSFIDALERDDFEALPPATFVRGYLKAYAGLLQIDAEPLLASFTAQGSVDHFRPLQVPGPVQTAPDMSRGLKRFMVWGIAVVGLLGAGMWVVDFYQGIAPSEIVPAPTDIAANMEPEQTSPEGPGLPIADEALPEVAEPDPEALFTDDLAGPAEGAVNDGGSGEASAPAEGGPGTGSEAVAATTPQPEPLAADANSPAAALETGADELLLRFSGPSWVEVYDADGEALLYGLIQETGERVLPGTAPYSVVIGDTDNVSLEYRGEAVDLGVRRPGRVARLQVPR